MRIKNNLFNITAAETTIGTHYKRKTSIFHLFNSNPWTNSLFSRMPDLCSGQIQYSDDNYLSITVNYDEFGWSQKNNLEKEKKNTFYISDFDIF
jgi:hypothetical protein